MTKATLKKEIFIDKIIDSKIISGYLMIKSSETITLDKIKGVVFIEVRGRMSSHRDNVFSFEIQKNKIITENKSYKIPFTFDSSNCEINSYHGKNTSFSYTLEIQIDINNNDIEKLERSVLSIVKSFVTSDYTIKISEYFEVADLNPKYQVVETKTNFTIQPNLIISIIILLIFGGIYAYIMPEYNIGYTILRHNRKSN